jgi:hypothetical protein
VVILRLGLLSGGLILGERWSRPVFGPVLVAQHSLDSLGMESFQIHFFASLPSGGDALECDEPFGFAQRLP